MAKASPRAPVHGPAFIRLLARFGDAGLPHTPPVLTERLAQWFDWNRAITLSRALDNRLPEAEARAALAEAEAEHHLPATDPVRFGVGKLVDRLLAAEEQPH